MSQTNKIFTQLALELPKDAKIVVACSGGIDSVVLLYALAEHPTLNCQLAVAHFNHKLRADSDNDATFVEKFSDQLGLTCHIGFPKTEIPRSGTEEWGRRERYAFFEQLRSNLNFDGIVTAHTASDVVETYLFKLFSNRELRQPAKQDQKRKLWRPLLTIWREEISQFAQQFSLSWREDPTNADHSFSRNKIRNVILPKLIAEWGEELPKTLLDSSNAVEADLAELHRMAEGGKMKLGNLTPLSKEWIALLKQLLSAESAAIGWRIIEKLFIPIIGFSLGRKHSIRLLEFVKSNAPGIELPNGVNIMRSEGTFKINK